jgi:hypothetical protein
MRFRVTIFGVLLISALLGCQKETIMPGITGGSLKAEVNGNTFEAAGILAFRTQPTSTTGEGFYVSGNTTIGFPQITLTLYSSLQGKYQLGVSGSGNTQASYALSVDNQELSISGNINITTINYSEGGTVKGTFEFATATNSITNGSFEIRFSN